MRPPDILPPGNLAALGEAVKCVCSYWGEPVKWGPNNKLPSAEACCADCHAHQPSTPEDLECNGKSNGKAAAALNIAYCTRDGALQLWESALHHFHISNQQQASLEDLTQIFLSAHDEAG